MPALKKKDPMGVYVFTDEEFDAARWCIKNGIVISPFPSSITTRWHIDIVINGKSNLSPKTFGSVEIWIKLYEYYLYYFNKYNKKDEKK